MAYHIQSIRNLSIFAVAIIETNLISSVNAQNFFGGNALNTVLLIIIIFAVYVIVILAGILIYLWWKRQQAEADNVKSGFAIARQKMAEKKQKETGADNPDEKLDMEDEETPGNLNDTPGNEADTIYLAKLAADKERMQKDQNSVRMAENAHLNNQAETFGGQLKDKQFGQKMVETDIVHQMHDDKTNKTPGYTPGYTPGSDKYVR